MRVSELIVFVSAALGTAALVFIGVRYGLDIASVYSQIGFWLTGLLVAWLTYVNARASLLQPLRTEVFKAQLSELQQVQAYFVMRDERRLREQFGYNRFVADNVRQLLDHFSLIHFGRGYDERPPGLEVGDGWRPLAGQVQRMIDDRGRWIGPNSANEAERQAFWRTYELPGLMSRREYAEGLSQVRMLLSTAFLPLEVRSPVEAYIGKVQELGDVVRSVLNECAAELPSRFNHYEALHEIRDGNSAEVWITNAVNRRFLQTPSLQELSHDVMRGIRTYLMVDRLRLDEGIRLRLFRR